MLRPHDPSPNLLPPSNRATPSEADLDDVDVIEVPYATEPVAPTAARATPSGRTARINARPV